MHCLRDEKFGLPACQTMTLDVRPVGARRRLNRFWVQAFARVQEQEGQRGKRTRGRERRTKRPSTIHRFSKIMAQRCLQTWPLVLRKLTTNPGACDPLHPLGPALPKERQASLQMPLHHAAESATVLRQAIARPSLFCLGTLVKDH